MTEEQMLEILEGMFRAMSLPKLELSDAEKKWMKDSSPPVIHSPLVDILSAKGGPK